MIPADFPQEGLDLVPDLSGYRSEAHFRHLLEKLPAGAYTCDRDGLITYFNQHAVRLWGRIPKLNHPEDRFCGSFKLFLSDGTPITHDQCWMAMALRQEEEFNGREIVIERPDGQRLTALAHANPIRSESGILLGAVNVLVDITDRKRHEEALKEADRSKNEFLAVLSHELRNPVAPIRNAVQMLQIAMPPVAELQWAVEIIDRQVGQMSRLIDDLLDLSRIANNKIELQKEPIALADVLATAVETSRPLIEAKGQELSVPIPGDEIVIEGDLIRLAQVVSNLLNNASKYNTPGGRIWLEAARDGNDAVVTVRDTGIGISAEALTRIFEMFVQAPGSAGHSKDGLGIGLTLAKRLVTSHGGTITAHSDGPGTGSEFVIRLPMHAVKPAVSGQATPNGDQEIPARRSSSNFCKTEGSTGLTR